MADKKQSLFDILEQNEKRFDSLMEQTSFKSSPQQLATVGIYKMRILTMGQLIACFPIHFAAAIAWKHDKPALTEEEIQSFKDDYLGASDSKDLMEQWLGKSEAKHDA